MQPAQKFTFTFYRFTGTEGARTTETVREFASADGMRGLVDRNPKSVELANQRVIEWANSKGITVTAQEPFPSEKHPGKVWLEYKLGGLTL